MIWILNSNPRFVEYLHILRMSLDKHLAASKRYWATYFSPCRDARNVSNFSPAGAFNGSKSITEVHLKKYVQKMKIQNVPSGKLT